MTGAAGGSTAGGSAGGEATAGGSSGGAAGGTAGGTAGGSTTTTDAGYPPLTAAEQAVLTQRPYRLVVPTSYDGTTEVPFMLLLHGYTDSGTGIDTYFKMSQLAQSRNFILATPNGLTDVTFLRYWNATDYCCGSTGTQKTDDVAYLTAIMNDVRLKYRIDPKRVFAVGHSNGGFMSHRLACDRADRIAGIVSFAGAQWQNLSRCVPSEKVSMLQVHGDNDGIVAYGGGTQYPGAIETTRDWAMLNGCTLTPRASAGADLDLTSDNAGAETLREQHTGCPPGTAVELWTIRGGSHFAAFTTAWAPAIYDFLMAHPKP